MSKGTQITESLLYLIYTWYDEGQITKFDFRNYKIIAKGGTLKQKQALWYDLTGSEFDFEQ